jgi:predicted RNase H-like HicB family nuclease
MRGIKHVTYTIIIEKAGNNYSAYAPDLPGCISTGPTIEETKRNMQEAIAFHLRGMREDGEPIPEPNSTAAVVEVAA